jgi:plasmid stabilization system protein ParE
MTRLLEQAIEKLKQLSPSEQDFVASKLLEEVADMEAHNNLSAASRFTDAIEEKCKLLLQFPKIGKELPEPVPNLHSFPFRDYIVFYRPNPEGYPNCSGPN